MTLRFYGSHERADERYEQQQSAAYQQYNRQSNYYMQGMILGALPEYNAMYRAYLLHQAQAQIKSSRELLADKFDCARTAFRGPPWEDLQ